MWIDQVLDEEESGAQGGMFLDRVPGGRMGHFLPGLGTTGRGTCFVGTE